MFWSAVNVNLGKEKIFHEKETQRQQCLSRQNDLFIYLFILGNKASQSSLD